MPRLAAVAHFSIGRLSKSSISCSSFNHCIASVLPVGILDWKDAPEPNTQQKGRSDIFLCRARNSLKKPAVVIFCAGINSDFNCSVNKPISEPSREFLQKKTASISEGR